MTSSHLAMPSFIRHGSGARPGLARIDLAAKRAMDVAVSGALLVLASPLIVAVAIAIRLESPGPVFFRCGRVGRFGRPIHMLKFRKMRDDASGPALTVSDDDRFTKVGRVLARTKLDEVPQLVNVLKGDMSLVGPRPEDPEFVALMPAEFGEILERARPGITGLCQLAFADESAVLAGNDRVAYYVERLLPQKVGLDLLYARHRTLLMDLQILAWTVAAVVLRRPVAVDRRTGRLSLRRRPTGAQTPATRAEATR